MDLRLGIRRTGRPGVGTRIIRFQGTLLVADGDIEVYLTPERRLVFYRDPRFGTDGSFWVFTSLGDAAQARAADGGALFGVRLLAMVAGCLNGV